jgi:hypothetical protein
MNQPSYITPAVLIVVRQTVIPYMMMDILIALYVTIMAAEQQMMMVNDRSKRTKLCYKVILPN